MTSIRLLSAVLLLWPYLHFSQSTPLRTAIAGLSHTHVHQIFNSENNGDIQIVGIAESDPELIRRYAAQYQIPDSLFFPDLPSMLQEVRPEAVTDFGPINGHLNTVKTCAPLGVHVMVEKPMATTLEEAKEMIALAEDHDIKLLTNYETTWYPATHQAAQLMQQQQVGALKKVVFHHGHRGPKKIGVDPEFLAWLTDPEKNGGGALMDFGCYGANIMTWLMQGEVPLQVTALTHQLQAENNPKVDDEAIILLKYREVTAVIQASWNWPIGRKDMELYGLKGSIYQDNREQVRVRIAQGYDGFKEETLQAQELDSPLHDPFAYMAAVIRKEIIPSPYDLSSLENNLLVIQILEAASKSAATGKTITLN